MQITLPKREMFIRAYDIVKQYVHRTQIVTSTQINDMVGNGNKVFFKCENLQKGGAYKARGACHAIEKLTQNQKDKGIVTHSSGNHGICVSMMGKRFGSKVTVVLPKDAPQNKIKIIESFGSKMIFTGGTKIEWVDALNKVVEETGAIPLPNDNNWDVIVGHGTAIMEMQEQLGETKLDYLLVPIGCGSFCAGSLLSNSYFNQNCKVIGVEPTLEQDTYLSLKSGKIVPQLKSNSICDGCRVHVGALNFEVLQKKKLHDLLLADDKDTIESMFVLWEKLKMLIEVSSALPFAALLKNKHNFKNANIGIILSGGNVDFQTLLPHMQKRFE